MELIDVKLNEKDCCICLCERIDSSNASRVEEEINAFLDGLAEKPKKLLLDGDKTEYISSAGIRVVLRLLKKVKGLELVNASQEVYEVLDMTGMTEIMPVSRAFRKISIEGCELIGRGSNGKVYRIDPETVVKVYKDPDSLPDIKRERELARTAFILGIPTAIPYDIVKAGESYGSVFELVNAKTMADLIREEPGRLEELIELSVQILKKIHETVPKEGTLPDMKKTAASWAEYTGALLSPEKGEKLAALIDALPERRTMLHGDYHVKNIMLQGDEALLIDMDTISTGHPVLEFASIFNAYKGFDTIARRKESAFLGLSLDRSDFIYRRTLELYFGTEDESFIRTVDEKAQLVGYTRLLRRSSRRLGQTEEGKAQIEVARQRLEELLERVDSLDF